MYYPRSFYALFPPSVHFPRTFYVLSLIFYVLSSSFYVLLQIFRALSPQFYVLSLLMNIYFTDLCFSPSKSCIFPWFLSQCIYHSYGSP